VFGAGATFDSVPDRPVTALYPALRPPLGADHPDNDRPPLANQLFDNRPQFVRAMTLFPSCLPLIPLLRKPGIIVETELARIREQAQFYPQAHKELASIQYYLHVAIGECQDKWRARHSGITNYATFLRQIERWRLSFNEKVCFVTFNYDTMLDEELARLLRVQLFRRMSEYAQVDYALIKLHGSINWGREVDGANFPTGASYHTLIEAAGSLEVSDRYRVMDGRPIYQVPNEVAVVFPALSIPVVNKDEFSCPRTHVELLSGMLPKVTKVISIGWRATEVEFLKMMQSKIEVKHPPLMIVSGDDQGAIETYNNLTGHAQRAAEHPYGEFPPGALRPGGWTRITNGFTGLINNLDVLETFLRSR
jgi:hypothetical protein